MVISVMEKYDLNVAKCRCVIYLHTNFFLKNIYTRHFSSNFVDVFNLIFRPKATVECACDRDSPLLSETVFAPF